MEKAQRGPQSQKPTVKHGGGGIMVWGCFGMENLVVIGNNMDQYKYINILKENLTISAQKLGIRSAFNLYKNNEHKHAARNVLPKCATRLLYNSPKIIKTPPYFPNLKPIEIVWHELERRARKHDISLKEQLKIVLIEKWDKFKQSYAKKILLHPCQNELKV